MALTIEVTKNSVVEIMPKAWNIVLELKILDNAIPVLTQNVSIPYKQGKSISDIESLFIEEMQKIVDKYKSEQDIYTNSQLDTSVTTIQSGIIT